MPSIVDDEQQRVRPQPPRALWVPAARGRLRRCRVSPMLRHLSSTRRLAAGPRRAERGRRDYSDRLLVRLG
jgi:hypothetical protein